MFTLLISHGPFRGLQSAIWKNAHRTPDLGVLVSMRWKFTFYGTRCPKKVWVGMNGGEVAENNRHLEGWCSGPVGSRQSLIMLERRDERLSLVLLYISGRAGCLAGYLRDRRWLSTTMVGTHARGSEEKRR